MLHPAFLRCPCPDPNPCPPGTSLADLTCEGPQPVNLHVVPKAAPRAVEGGGYGQGRVEEGAREWPGCMGREAQPSVSLASFERSTKSWTRRPGTPPACKRLREHLCCPALAAAYLGSVIAAHGEIPPSLRQALWEAEELSAGWRGCVRGHSRTALPVLGQAMASPVPPFHLLPRYPKLPSSSQNEYSPK